MPMFYVDILLALSMFQHADRQYGVTLMLMFYVDILLALSMFQHADRQYGVTLMPMFYVDILLALSMFQYTDTDLCQVYTSALCGHTMWHYYCFNTPTDKMVSLSDLGQYADRQNDVTIRPGPIRQLTE